MAEHEPMVEAFIYETRQFLEQLEQLGLASEENGSFKTEDVNEFFRAMHTIKGSAAMMMLEEISHLAHAVEDIFYYIRELHPESVDVTAITDIVLNAVDFMNIEINKLDEGKQPDASSQELREYTHTFLRNFKIANGHDPDVDLRKAKTNAPPKIASAQQYFIAAAKPTPTLTEAAAKSKHVYRAVIFFQKDCGMAEVRAFSLLNRLEELAVEIHSLPERLLEDDGAAEMAEKGLRVWMTSEEGKDEIQKIFDETSYVEKMDFAELKDVAECEYWPTLQEKAMQAASEAAVILPTKPEARPRPTAQPSGAHDGHETQMISVRVDKLDRLMDLVGELVIAESMVTQNQDLKGLTLTNFDKAARQLHKINGELQDSVMALRMVPLEATFKKMNRIVRDMTKKLGKKARLVLVGAETEVDKNISEHIGDPLMHIVRNAVDHGIEMPEVRIDSGKEEQGTVLLSAQNAGGEVIIRVRDDGAGMSREKLLAKARDKGLLTKPESDYTDQEVYSFIFAAGFSTKEQVTEFSGRGVGMDVVVSNLRLLGGNVTVDSTPGIGSETVIRIPLTLAIIEGMCVKVGESDFTIPISAIRRSFRPVPGQVFMDAAGQEMFMEQGHACPVLRLHRHFDIPGREELTEGILMVTESDGRLLGIFADELLGVQQIVVKPVPAYIHKMMKTTGITGCTLLGDGSVSLIVDPVKLSGQLMG